MYRYEGDLRLCLKCHTLLQDNNYRTFLMNATMLNQSMDHMDMVTGIHLGGKRISVNALAKAMSKPMTSNHINISNSSVGVLNTGDLAKINAVITITEGSDVEELGHEIRNFAQAVVDSQELPKETKQEVGELLGTLSEQIAGKRSKSVIGAVLKGIEERVKSANTLWAFGEKISKLLISLGIL